jgi:hypothetical protein
MASPFERRVAAARGAIQAFYRHADESERKKAEAWLNNFEVSFYNELLYMFGNRLSLLQLHCSSAFEDIVLYQVLKKLLFLVFFFFIFASPPLFVDGASSGSFLPCFCFFFFFVCLFLLFCSCALLTNMESSCMYICIYV